MTKADGDVLSLMKASAAKPAPQDKLDKLRAKIREVREIEMQRKDLVERNAALGTRLYEIQTKELVDLFDAAKVDNVGIPEEGNLPAYNMEIGTIVKANIGTFDDPKVDDFGKSIEYIKKLEPAMIKTTYVVGFGLGEDKRRKEFEKLLKTNKYDYSSSFGVPWNTLTAWVKEALEDKKLKSTLNLKLLGATVERTAKLIKPKATRAKKAAQEARSTPTRGK